MDRLGKQVRTASQLLLVILTISRAISSTDVNSFQHCEIPCHNENNSSRPCVSYTCYTQGVMTTCNLNSIHSSNADMHKVECLAPEDVKGLPEFCQRILQKTREPEMENILKKETTTSIEVDRVEAVNESPKVKEQCLSVTILASVATGSFIAGCFLTWLILILLRCFNPCGNRTTIPQKRSRGSSNESINDDGTGSRHRITSNVSVDSGLSSTQVTSQHHQTPDPHHTTRATAANGRLFQYNSTLAAPRTVNNINYGTNQTLDFYGIYTPISEGSNKDYHSILGSSVYAPSSEGGNSDYSCQPTHRVLFIRENGEIYQPSSESSSNDYSSLKGARCLVNGAGVYYATSDSSYKDYTSLFDEHEQDLAAGYCDPEDMIVDGTNPNMKFKVNGFVIPKAKLALIGKPAPGLRDVNEYEVVHEKSEPNVLDEYSKPLDAVSKDSDKCLENKLDSVKHAPEMLTLSEIGAARSRLAKKSLPHDYLVLEKEDDL